MDESCSTFCNFIMQVKSNDSSKPTQSKNPAEEETETETETDEDSSDDADDCDRQGSWLRRRRLDGALNRVPRGFYARIWRVLEKCHSLSMQSNKLEFGLTQEVSFLVCFVKLDKFLSQNHF